MSASKPILILNLLKADKIIEAAKKYALTKSRMSELASIFDPLAGMYTLQFKSESRASNNELKQLIDGRFYGTTAEMRQIFYSLMLGEGNLDKAFGALPSTVQTLLKAGATQRFISARLIMATIQETPERWTTGSGMGRYVSYDYVAGFFNSSARGVLSLSPLLADALADKFGISGEKTSIRTTDTIDSNLSIINYEAGIKREIAGLKDFMTSNNMTMSGGANAYTASDISTACSGCDIDEPFADAKIKALRTMRTRMMMLLVSRIPHTRYTSAPDTDDLLKQIRKIFTGQASCEYCHFISAAVPYLQHMAKGLFYRQFLPVTVSVIFEPLRQISASGAHDWFDADSYVKSITETAIAKGENFITINELSYYSLTDSFTGAAVAPTNIDRIYIPAVISGALMMLAAVGGLEIAYDPNRTGMLYPLECIRAFRLTDDGRYFLGLTDEFKNVARDASDAQAAITLDPDNLIILINKPLAAQAIRSAFGTKITSNRYAVTPQSLFEKNYSLSVLQNNRKLLLNLARLDELPPMWEQLFDSAARRLRAIRPERIYDYSLYRIEPDDTELVSLLTTVAEIHDMVLLVEGGRFMVRTSDVRELRELLQAYGYNLPQGYF